MCITCSRRLGSLFLLLASLTTGPAVSFETLVIGGTGGALGTMQRLSEAYCDRYPQCAVTVLPSLGTGGGVRALADHHLDIALVARPLNVAEREFGLRVLPYARTALVFVTHEDKRVRALTTDALVEIYRGSRTTWPDGRRCRPILRPANDAETRALRALSPALDAALAAAFERNDLVITLTAQENLSLVERIPGAFGYTSLAQVMSEASNLKVLPLDGVEPNLEQLRAGGYPLVNVFSLVTESDPSDEVERFIEFIFSGTGRAIIKASGSEALERPDPAQ